MRNKMDGWLAAHWLENLGAPYYTFSTSNTLPKCINGSTTVPAPSSHLQYCYGEHKACSYGKMARQAMPLWRVLSSSPEANQGECDSLFI